MSFSFIYILFIHIFTKKEVFTMNENVNNSGSKMILLVLYFGWIISYIDRTVISLAIVQIGEDFTLDALGIRDCT